MERQLALEIIGGPMDGLNRPLTGKEIGIGRKVGQEITLDRDRKISNRHACVRLEGHDWYLKESRRKPSKNGTCLDGKWIEPGEKYPLKSGQVILIASTLLEVTELSDADKTAASFGYDEWDDPMTIYSMTPKLKDLWQRMQSDNREKGFIDTRDLFKAIVGKKKETGGGLYECVVNAKSQDAWVALGEWIVSKRLAPLYNIDAQDFIIPRRIWKILDIASLDKTKTIGSKAVLQGIICEGRSIPARYMAQDGHFLKTIGLTLPEIDIPKPAGSITDGSFSRTENIQNDPPVFNHSMTAATILPQNRFNAEEVRFWKSQVTDFETTILAFLEDAVIPPGVNVHFTLPGFDKRLDEFRETSDKAETDKYLKALRAALFNMMDAYKEGTKRLEREILSRLREMLRVYFRTSDAKLWSIGKGDDSEKLAGHVENVLKRIEEEALGERIIQQIIRLLYKNGGRL